MMTPEQRAELRRIADAATSGPWEIQGPWPEVTLYQYQDEEDPRAPNKIASLGECRGHDNVKDDPDAAFIAAARTALPALLDEVDRLEAENERLRSAALEWQAAYSRITDEAARRALGEGSK
jgi:hypothetical protein